MTRAAARTLGNWKCALLVIALCETEAFSPGSTYNRPGLVPTFPDRSRAFKVLGKSYQPRSRASLSKVYVAAGRSLNNKENENTFDDDEELPWECIVDPLSYEEDCQHVGYNQQQLDYGTWAKEEPTDHVTLADKVSMTAAFSVVIASFALLLFASGPGSWRFFLAGGLCAAASHAIPTPIDVVKTRLQVDTDLQHLSFIQATRKIIKNEGIGALLVGLGPTVLGYLMEGSMKFGVYEVLKPATTRMLSELAEATSLGFLRSQIIAFMACGLVAGTAASITLAPMEALRIRLVSEPDFAPKGWIQGGRRMIKREGVLSLWRGLGAQIFKQVPYTVTKNVSFDVFTKAAYRIAIAYGFAMNHATKFTIPLVAAVLASILSCIASQPGDMLLSLVSAHQGEQRSATAIGRDIMRSDKGIRGFFVGLNCRLYHVGIIVTLQLVLYDFLKQLCGGIATGVH